MNKEWVKNRPEKVGFYWFYGDPFSIPAREKHIKIYYVEVWKISNGFAYVANGNFMANTKGFWQQIDLPDYPKNP